MPIIAIGGGELGEGETLDIDRFIVHHANSAQPRALFVPTASGDAPGYIETFERVYGDELGCEVRSLALHSEPGDAEIATAIGWAEIIYVGGGNTRMMLELWRQRGVDRLLREAWQQGTLLCGLSAGANCWFEAGFSDSQRFDELDTWAYTRVPGLGLVPGLFCPHLDAEHRTLPLLEHLEGDPMPAWAATNNAAVVIKDGQASVLTCKPGAGVFHITPEGGRLSWRRQR